MKTTAKLLALAIIVLIAINSCKKEDNTTINSNANIATNAQQGSWKITYYSSNGTDETNHYTGYTFQFNSGGTIAATNSSGTVSGTWSNGNDDSQVKFILNFGTITPFEELNNDWHVTQQSSSIIKLEDVSGGNGGTDLLTFEKI